MDRVVLQIELAIAEDIVTDPTASTTQRVHTRRNSRNLRTGLARLRHSGITDTVGLQITMPTQTPKSHT